MHESASGCKKAEIILADYVRARRELQTAASGWLRSDEDRLTERRSTDAGGARQTIGAPHGCGATNVSESECNHPEAIVSGRIRLRARRASDAGVRLAPWALRRYPRSPARSVDARSLARA